MDSDQGGGQWLTYAEAARRFWVSPEAARQLARRRGWQRRTPNEPNETARIFVPDDAYVWPRTPVNGVSQPSKASAMNGLDRVVEAENVRSFELAISTLSAQLDRERNRVDRAERLLDEERERSGKLEASLSDAIGAERIASARPPRGGPSATGERNGVYGDGCAGRCAATAENVTPWVLSWYSLPG